jgi:hypothetical protein
MLPVEILQYLKIWKFCRFDALSDFGTLRISVSAFCNMNVLRKQLCDLVAHIIFQT